MKITQRQGKAAFTLIELMAVVTIIVILAGLVVGGMGFVTERQAKEKARVQIALLSKAIEEYKLDMGVYPGVSNAYGGVAATAAAGTNSSRALYNALFKEGFDYTNPTTPPTTNRNTKAKKIYLPDLDPRVTKQGWVTPTATPTTAPRANLDILDPWGRPYLYRVGTLATGAPNGNAQNPDFDLWSRGKDDRTQTSAAKLNHADNRDDIKNF